MLKLTKILKTYVKIVTFESLCENCESEFKVDDKLGKDQYSGLAELGW